MQTAVEWLKKQFDRQRFIEKIDFDAAMQMEKQQIIDAFDEGQEYEYQYHINNAPKFDSQTYFAETYRSKGSDEGSSLEWNGKVTEGHNIHTSSRTEISDEEIYKEAEHKSKIFRGWTTYETSAFIMACQWYREQIKKTST